MKDLQKYFLRGILSLRMVMEKIQTYGIDQGLVALHQRSEGVWIFMSDFTDQLFISYVGNSCPPGP